MIAGVLGISFYANFLDSKGYGFWIAVGAMAGWAISAVWLAKRREWL